MNDHYLGTLTLEEKVGQMLLAGFEGLEPPDYILDWLREGRIGGVILFARNVANPEQLTALTRAVHQAAKFPALIAIDQEGGTVARLREGFTESPGAMALAAAPDSETLTEQVSRVLGVEMQALGINWTYAPAVDISYNADNPTVGTRSFGSDKEHVSQLAAAAVRGFQSGGVAACTKHFPGLGNTSVDTHLALPELDIPVEQILMSDLMPYRVAMSAGMASIMTTHTIFKSLDAQYPATLSPIIVQRLLRQELGFDGVVTTDCMDMKAISDHHTAADSAVLAAKAGIDIILFSHIRARQEEAFEGLLAAAKSGELPLEMVDAANVRIAALKAAYPANASDVSLIRNQEHLDLAQNAAREGTVLLYDHAALLPLSDDALVVEFASYLDSIAVEEGGLTGFGQLLAERFPDLKQIALKAVENTPEEIESVLTKVQEAPVLVLATRNAHMIPEELDLAQQFIAAASRTILICLRNPYDAGALNADAVLCTCGDSQPSLQAAVDALAGDYIPTGRLPVELA